MAYSAREAGMDLARIGLGTYLGAADDATDAAYADAARAYLEGGGNVLDTAANYRMGRSERALGRALEGVARDTVFVSTKAGYLPMGDGLRRESPAAWFQRVLAGPGILGPDEVVDGCHAMTPRYIAHQARVSLEALGLARVDVLHLHNPEQQLGSLSRPAFRESVRRAFAACEELVAEGLADAYGCATWNGFRVPPEARDHLSLEELLEDAGAVAGPGLLAPEEVVDGCHALTPRYIAHQARVSLEALGLARVDLLHLHNPEHQLGSLPRPAFREALRRAFGACEELVAAGLAGAYGCATWNGFRVPPGARDHLALEELLADAEAVAGSGHHFRWIQLPLNLAMPEAFLEPTQAFGGRRMPALEAALAAGMRVQVSASLMQARILSRLPQAPGAILPGCATPAQAALHFAASCPGVDVALCGMASRSHVAENLAVLALAPPPAADLEGLLR